MEHLVHSLNFYGILLESFAVIFSWKKIFTHITLATIFPLSLLSLAHALISDHIFSNNNNPNMAFWLFKTAYVVLFLALSLLSTSAVVYAVALIYTTKEVRFGQVMSVVPRVWRRLMITFGWSLLIVVVYNMAAFSLLYPRSRSGSIAGLITGRVAISGPVFAIYMVGFVYISLVWHLASVVSVLEEECGVEAMVKGQELVRGKMVISGGVFLVLNLCFILIQVVFDRFVVGGELVWSRIWWGVGCLLVVCGFTLLGLVSQTVVYFVCKLYHSQLMVSDASSPLLQNQNHQKIIHFGDYAPLGLGSHDVQQLDLC